MDLGIGAAQTVTPEMLAELLGIEIRAGDELIPRKRFTELEKVQPGAFSACTFRPSTDRVVVVYNPLSAKSRQRSDLAHELAHTLLEHELSRVEKLGDVTFLSCDPTQEEEAAWLSGCLLLPRALLLSEIRRGSGAGDIANKYGVSERMAQRHWRGKTKPGCDEEEARTTIEILAEIPNSETPCNRHKRNQ